MAIVEDIKCPRCDRKYSGVRSRCPYCGARRIGFGKYSRDDDNAKGKMIISVLILAVFTVAAGIMMMTTPDGSVPEVVEETPDINEIISFPTVETMTPEPTPRETPTPEPVLLSVQIWVPRSHRVTDFTEAVGTSIPLTAYLEPATYDGMPVWSDTNDPDNPVFEWEETSDGIIVKILRSGAAQIILTVDGMTESCWVRGR